MASRNDRSAQNLRSRRILQTIQNRVNYGSHYENQDNIDNFSILNNAAIEENVLDFPTSSSVPDLSDSDSRSILISYNELMYVESENACILSIENEENHTLQPINVYDTNSITSEEQNILNNGAICIENTCILSIENGEIHTLQPINVYETNSVTYEQHINLNNEAICVQNTSMLSLENEDFHTLQPIQVYETISITELIDKDNNTLNDEALCIENEITCVLPMESQDISTKTTATNNNQPNNNTLNNSDVSNKDNEQQLIQIITTDATQDQIETRVNETPEELLASSSSISEQNTMDQTVKPTRNKKPDPRQWIDNKNKRKRELGEDYIGWTRKENVAKRGEKREERKIGQTCLSIDCLKRQECHKISETQRQALFDFFWKKLSWDQKKIYVTALVSKNEPKRRRGQNEDDPKRKWVLHYKLKVQDSTMYSVCKSMFLSTLGLKEWTVLNWVKASTHGMLASSLGNRVVRNRNISIGKTALITFLDELPKLPSHYCRQSSSKLYLEPTFGNAMVQIYNEYVKKCSANDPIITPVSRFCFDAVIKDKNIAIQQPKKDRCDVCIGFETNNINEVIFNEHISRKKMARSEKENDIKNAKEGKCITLTVDLQAVKVCPSINASALYYKTKLCNHNYSVYDTASRRCRCYWFNETDADLSANTFASCLIDFLSDHLSGRNLPIIIWSDGCTYQNRNAVVANALLSFSSEKNVTIHQKYLEKGHTQMEVDSVHSNIEKKIKNRPIHLPSDYARLSLDARKVPMPYEVKIIEYPFCKNYGVDIVYNSIRPGKLTGDPQVTDLKVIKYTPDGIIQVKTNFQSNYEDLPFRKSRKHTVKPLDGFPQLHTNRIPIKSQKWQHLQQLKSVLPQDCHAFYDNLPHA